MQNFVPQSLTDDQLLQKLQKDEKKFRFLLPSLVLRLKYQLWLVLLREVSILVTLTKNYDKIPAKTPTRFVVSLFVNISIMKNLLFAVEKRLRKRIY